MLENRVSQLDSKLELLTEELRDVKPASHSFWVLRQSELRIKTERNGTRCYIVADLATIANAERERAPDLDILKDGSLKMYGAHYGDVKRQQPQSVFLVIDIHFNITTLNEWKEPANIHDKEGNIQLDVVSLTNVNLLRLIIYEFWELAAAKTKMNLLVCIIHGHLSCLNRTNSYNLKQLSVSVFMLY